MTFFLYVDFRLGFLETESVAEICKQEVYWEVDMGTAPGRKRLDGVGLDRRNLCSHNRGFN